MVDRIVYRDSTDERPRPGDRIVVIVRCDFLLDACCRPVDGNHVGGRVAYVGGAGGKGDPAEHAKGHPPEAVCAGLRAASGIGSFGGSFESWFYIARDKEGPA
jgi:hypothetical protein